ncbi:MAG: Bifunctional protein GlmU [Candidatus Methanofastidiosum methylothiophilum]|uniref:Bifunctional protein GlmU n=1 Tax=Candidatus Methanofastidiosum methylothiophilum TaxID=1705564 RepID=A0A150J9Y0_9EURY|nr:MAG: Bifunctional protein GlmU [Candidatus Methanofastidiosum methylthiophilus]
MLPLGDTTILGNILKIFKSSGISKISIVVGHKSEIIKNYLNENDFGIQIKFIEQKERLGTGHALMIASKYVKSDFICVYGDLLFRQDFIESLISNFMSSDSIAIMALTESDTPEFYGSVLVKGDKVVGIFEKSDNPPSNLINTGIYCFRKEAFEYINKTQLSPRGEYELTDSIKMMMESGNNIKWVTLGGKWLDIGRPWDLIDANEFFLESMKNYISKNSVISSDSKIGTPVYIDFGAFIENSVIESPCLISKNTKISKGTKISCSVIRENVTIGKNCIIENSLIMDRVKIGDNSKISYSIIGEESNIGNNVVFESSSDKNIFFEIKGVMVDTNRRKLGSILGKRVKIEDNKIINPGQKIESNKII